MRTAAQARAAKARAQAAWAKRAATRGADALVARPSNAGKQVKAGTGAGAVIDRSKLYWDFWEQFLNRVSSEHPEWTKRRKTPTRDSRYNLPTGTSAVGYSTAFTQHGLSVQLYFSSPDAAINLCRFEEFRAMKDRFEQALGQAAEWDDKPGKKATAISVTSQFDNVADVDLWPAMLDWVLDQHVRFRQAVEAVGGAARLKVTVPRIGLAEAG